MTSPESAPRAHPIRWILAILLFGVVGTGVYFFWALGPTAFAEGKRVALADYHDKDPTGVPDELKSASLVERGEYLTNAADCRVCHTVEGGTPFAGGRAFVLPFGTIYSTNITPDAETGIGSYSDAEFLNAVHKGIRRDSAALYPAMPYASYTYMADADALAIKAYLATLQPVHAPALQNTLTFPLNQRGLMRIWSARLSDRGHGPLRRVPHAAQPRLRAQQSAEVCRRSTSGLACLQHHLRPRQRRRRLGRYGPL